MQKPMTGVRVLEVAQFTFVPSAGAVLADWGADVIKIENPVTGDAQRGLVTVAGHTATAPGVCFAPMIEAPNRGSEVKGSNPLTGQNDIDLIGLRYLQTISDLNTGDPLHVEPGFWLHVPATQMPAHTG